ncbi:hypothetical protein HA402_004536 [Bradysia odoriphaga]|nr:hypothetical protein HA402_004536 [Bradysia odoriphaga]
MPETNEYGQPVGDIVPDWKPRPPPAPVTLNGRSCRLEPLNTNKHADDLYAAFSHDDGRLWTYMPEGPFPNIEEFREFIEAEVGNDFQDFAVVDLATVKPVGMIALKRPDPQNGVVEGGRAVFSPLLQQSILSSEAQFLLASYVFDHLGYRRYKWCCGSHNVAARKAVERIGFKLDGVFCKAQIILSAIIDLSSNEPIGLMALKRPDPQHGKVGLGRPVFSPLLKLFIQSIDSQYILKAYVFDRLKYRRYEWSSIIISIHNGRCKIDLKRDKEVIIDIDSPELHQSQYHTADFDTSAYNYGYAVEPNGQFHHETRGGDGVTYGCYGYIDSDDLLKVTHYVADSQGYRTLEHEKPVLVYPVNENNVDADEKPYKPKGVMLDWKDLYFPIGCGMAKGGVILNAPVIRAPGGIFQQLGETKFPVQPSPEPKVVVPRIPFNSPMKTEPTKLIPISTGVSTYTKQQSPKTTAPVIFSSPEGVNPSRRTTQRPTINSNTPTKPSTINTQGVNPSTRTTQRPTINSNTPTKPSTINAHVNGPEYATKISYRQNQQSTVLPIVNSSNHPTRAGTSPSPIRESGNNGPSTVTTPSDKFILQKVTPSISPLGQSDYTDDLLPPFRTTNTFDTHTTVGLPINSFNPGNDLNVINSYVNLSPDSPTTTEPSYFGDITTAVPIQRQPFSNSYNNNGPSTVASTKYPAIDSTEKISSIRPTNFDGFKYNTQTTTGTPFDLATESNADSTNPDSPTIYTDAESLSTPADERSTPYASRRPIETSHSTLTKSSSSRQDSTSKTLGVNY